MNVNRIDDRFSTTAQITPDDVAAIKNMGFTSIVCARPDDEDRGQPAFAVIARAAERHGLAIVHIPVSGPLSQEQIVRFHNAMAEIAGPVLGYCRSGARAGSLYATLNR